MPKFLSVKNVGAYLYGQQTITPIKIDQKVKEVSTHGRRCDRRTIINIFSVFLSDAKIFRWLRAAGAYLLES